MQLKGIILKGIGGFYYVEAADAVYECKARGAFRKRNITPVAGDRVEISVREGSENTIDEILPRSNHLKRPPIANLNQLVIVASICEPNPSTLIIDKLTAISQSQNIEPVIVISKTDMADSSELTAIYQLAGFKTFTVSGITGEGISELKEALRGTVSAFTGNSGVGKSTLLNCIDSRLKLSTGEISEKLGRGRHTTRQVELFKIEDFYVADTPGFSALDFEKNELILKEDLQFCFREFLPHLGECKFSTCAHITDKGCKILEEIEKGNISKSRHNSYVAMYHEVKDIKEWEV